MRSKPRVHINNLLRKSVVTVSTARWLFHEFGKSRWLFSESCLRLIFYSPIWVRRVVEMDRPSPHFPQEYKSMTRANAPPLNCTASQLQTTLTLTFAGCTDGHDRRVRYLARQGEEMIWRVDERRSDGDWTIIDAEPVENLHLNVPDATTTASQRSSGR